MSVLGICTICKRHVSAWHMHNMQAPRLRAMVVRANKTLLRVAAGEEYL